MPILEFVCEECGNAFEELVPSTDQKAPCTRCGSRQVEKQLSTFSASVAAGTSSPCAESGGCPSAGMAGSGCSTGSCPFSG